METELLINLSTEANQEQLREYLGVEQGTQIPILSQISEHVPSDLLALFDRSLPADARHAQLFEMYDEAKITFFTYFYTALTIGAQRLDENLRNQTAVIVTALFNVLNSKEAQQTFHIGLGAGQNPTDGMERRYPARMYHALIKILEINRVNKQIAENSTGSEYSNTGRFRHITRDLEAAGIGFNISSDATTQDFSVRVEELDPELPANRLFAVAMLELLTLTSFSMMRSKIQSIFKSQATRIPDAERYWKIRIIGSTESAAKLGIAFLHGYLSNMLSCIREELNRYYEDSTTSAALNSEGRYGKSAAVARDLWIGILSIDPREIKSGTLEETRVPILQALREKDLQKAMELMIALASDPQNTAAFKRRTLRNLGLLPEEAEEE